MPTIWLSEQLVYINTPIIHFFKTSLDTNLVMAANKAVGTDDLLRNILLELQTLNRNLGIQARVASSEQADCSVPVTERALASLEQVILAEYNNTQGQREASTESSASEQDPLVILSEKGDDDAILWMKNVLP